MFFFSSRRRHTRCALVTGVQTCALPISQARPGQPLAQARAAEDRRMRRLLRGVGVACCLALAGCVTVPDGQGVAIGDLSAAAEAAATATRSEERRVGKEWVSTCISRGSPYH